MTTCYFFPRRKPELQSKVTIIAFIAIIFFARCTKQTCVERKMNSSQVTNKQKKISHYQSNVLFYLYRRSTNSTNIYINWPYRLSTRALYITKRNTFSRVNCRVSQRERQQSLSKNRLYYTQKRLQCSVSRALIVLHAR